MPKRIDFCLLIQLIAKRSKLGPRLFKKCKTIHLINVLTQQLTKPFIAKPWIDSRLQLLVISRRKTLSNITLDHPAIRIIPFFNGAVWKALSNALLFILSFSTQKISPHLLFQHVDSVVLPLASLSRKGIERNGWRKSRIDHIIRQIPLNDFVSKRRSIYLSLLWLKYHECIKIGREIRSSQNPIAKFDEVFCLISLKPCFRLLVPLSHASFLVGSIHD